MGVGRVAGLQKAMNALSQVTARGGKPIIMCTEVRACARLPSRRRTADRSRRSVRVVREARGHGARACVQGDTSIPAGLHKISIPPIIDCLQGLLMVVPLQLLSYHLAVVRGFNVCAGWCTGPGRTERDLTSSRGGAAHSGVRRAGFALGSPVQVDQPRNLAKSVTVE